MKNSKNIFSSLRQSFLITFVLMIICGLLFPLVLTGMSSVLFAEKANGSIIDINDKKYGSKIVGQEFKENYYMWSRPSSVKYDIFIEDNNGNQTYTNGEKFNGVSSGSQNLAPSNPDLAKRVEEGMTAFLKANPDVKQSEIPADLLTASGSGLDPHISYQSALIQISRIVKYSGLDEAKIKSIVEKNTENKLFGVFGEKVVNVLGVNIDIAKEINKL
ncbi:potassium-transporting ATPase subunit KdpC [Helcococcus kunzii]|uniref:Potassium-transporting ATPase KdpC subunit n=1 Tax=Helcococcus kunzii ATCC 51366 TaxID=883114 RepID=H3NLX6_9FIRM|nr:potassium-transporting ATPase subunit KdpC [Helcococcus kunzii]EHR35646.1 K+-transporting ATPase, C subunit [Helcococcus kunzii ATCC 51366]MCT1796212.1 potassium-transporting ATPase subunit KdpC [Helcococcus kunzii]MCT1988933.1 potassium-transporting ATPase subunit KdpC [Helcococcus kunzii]